MAEVTKTIGAAGDFATPQAWADDINTNGGAFYTTGDIAIGQLLEDFAGSTSDLLEFLAANGSNPIAKAILEPSSGNAHDGVIGGGITLSTTSGFYAIVSIDGAVDYDVEIRDVDFLLNVSTGSYNRSECIEIANANSITIMIKRCIFRSSEYSCADTYTPFGIRRYGSTACTTIAVRCLAKDIRNPQTSKGTGFRSLDKMYNCSAYNCDEYGLHDASYYTEVSNTICMDCGVDFSMAGAPTRDKNMSSDATAPGTTNYRNEVSTSIWVDPAGDDFTLQLGTNAINNGNAISDAENHIDITGYNVWEAGGEGTGTTGTAESFDLGAYEYQAPSGGISAAPIQFVFYIGFN